MALGGIWSRLTGGIVGAGVGIATADVAAPILEPERQATWQANPFRVLDLADLARLVAQAITDAGSAADQAARSGYDANKLAARIQLALVAPPVAEAIDLRRRGKITAAQFEHALAKAQIEPQYWPALTELIDERLDPAVIAVAVQRGILANAGLLPVGPPTEVGKVPPMPMVDLDPITEAAASGVNFDRLATATRIVGLPPAPGELLDLVNRGVITDVDYFRGVAEGNTRNEWGKFLLELRHQLLTPEQAATLRLKGWFTREQSLAAGALRGAGAELMDNLFLAAGRPAAPVQMFTAWARGVTGPDGKPMDEAQFLKGIRESDIRPEWGPMLWGIRHAYPSLFQLRRAVQDGSISAARALVILRFERYEDQDAQALVTSWTRSTVAGSKALTRTELDAEYEGGYIDEAQLRAALQTLGYAGQALDLEVALGNARLLKTIRNRVVAALEKLYAKHKLSEAQARADLARAGVTADAIDRILPLWTLERDAASVSLTRSEIVAAFAAARLTQADALMRLEDLGFSLEDARLLLGL